MTYPKPKFLDFFIPSIIFFGLMVLFHESFIDERVASLFFSSGDWVYRNNFFLEKILHKGGVIFSTAILVGILAYAIFVMITKPQDKKLRDYLVFSFSGAIITILVVFFLKRSSTFPCPWDSIGFGGGVTRPGILQMFSPLLSKERCFPGGHSSGGYGLLSLYFGYLFIYGKRNLATLLPGVIIGVVFGLTQQARGAHFLSHDMATIFISILSSWVTSWIYYYYNLKHEDKIIPN